MNRVWQRNFFRNFEQMLSAGLPLSHCISLNLEMETSHQASAGLEKTLNALLSGSSLSSSLRLSGLYGSFQLNLIQTGEKTGSLVKVISFLADYLERRDRLERKIKTSLLYPAFSLLVCGFGLITVPPQLMQGQIELLKSSGVELPLLTRFLIKLSELLGSWFLWFGLAVALGASAWLLRKLRSNPVWQYWMARSVLWSPLGKIYRELTAARFARSFAVGMNAGIPLEKNLRMSVESAGNPVLTGQVELMRRTILDAGSLSEAFGEAGIFSPTFLAMITVGEETGCVVELLTVSTEMLELELEHTLERFVLLIEPMALAVMGIVVGVFALGLLLPTVRLLENL